MVYQKFVNKIFSEDFLGSDLIQGTNLTVAMVANATSFSLLLPVFKSSSKLLLLDISSNILLI